MALAQITQVDPEQIGSQSVVTCVDSAFTMCSDPSAAFPKETIPALS